MENNNDVGFLIKQISETIEKYANHNLKQIDLTLSQGRVLGYLHERQGLKTSQKHLETFLNVSHPTIVGILKRLECKGLIVSVIDENDKRSKNIYLTKSEIQSYTHIKEFQNKMEHQLLIGLAPDEIKVLKIFLKKILGNIHK